MVRIWRCPDDSLSHLEMPTTPYPIWRCLDDSLLHLEMPRPLPDASGDIQTTPCCTRRLPTASGDIQTIALGLAHLPGEIASQLAWQNRCKVLNLLLIIGSAFYFDLTTQMSCSTTKSDSPECPASYFVVRQRQNVVRSKWNTEHNFTQF